MTNELVTLLMSGAFKPNRISQLAYELRVVEGPDAGRHFRIDASVPPQALLGQSPVCQFALTDPSVSRRHLSLELGETNLRVTDLRSKNGTTINGVSVVEAFLSGGELLRLGSTGIRVELCSTTEAISLPTQVSFGGYVGASTEMRRLYPLMDRIAASNIPVLIEGETGTGKEVLAEAIHAKGPRASGPFVGFDCTAVPANLLEAELFGYERGAFTGAANAKPGMLEVAAGGTLFIDEIGDLDLAMQPKLLRALDRQEARRLGGTSTVRVDVRLLAATRRNLDEEVQAGRFRDDLFHRIAIGRIQLPPLRERKGDVTVLARHFAESLGVDPGSLDASALLRWESHTWPGNVRELRGAVARFLALGQVLDLRPSAKKEGATPVAFVDEVLALDLPLSEARRRVVEAFEELYVERILDQTGGNVSKAAEKAGVTRRHLHTLKARGQ